MSYGSVEASWAGIRLRFPVAGILYTSQLRVVLEWKWDRDQLTKPRDARNIPIVVIEMLLLHWPHLLSTSNHHFNSTAMTTPKIAVYSLSGKCMPSVVYASALTEDRS